MPAVLLLRHGQASFGTADYDVLSDRGHEQAGVVKAALDGRGIVPSRIFPGDMQRQLGTAAPWTAAGTDIGVDPRLNEYSSEDVLAHFSEEHLSLERGPDDPEISSRDFQALLDVALFSWIDAGSGGGADESFAAFKERCRSALADLAAAVPKGETGLAVTSGGVIGLLCAAALDLPDRAMVAFNRVTVNAALTKLIIGRSGTSLVTFNEHSHLPQELVTYR